MLDNLKKCYGMLLGVGAIETAKSLAQASSPEEVALALTVAPVLTIFAGLLPNLASDKIAESEREKFAARNHHLRAGMAAALRTALRQTRRDYEANGPLDPLTAARFDHWDRRLDVGDDRGKVNGVIPELAEEDLFDVSSGSPGTAETAAALGDILYNWVTADPRLASAWTPQQARDLALDVSTHYFHAFKQAAINDHQSHLFQAFTVNGFNRLITLGDEIREHVSEQSERVIEHVSEQTERVIDEIRHIALPSAPPAIPADCACPSSSSAARSNWNISSALS